MATANTDLVQEADGSYSKQVRTVAGGTAQASVTYAHTTATATTTTGAALDANTGRKFALIQNAGTVPVYVKVGAAAVASEGIRIGPDGGALTIAPGLGNFSPAAINCITASGAALLLVTEGS